MTNPPLVPPLKCQGIKTKLVGEISALAASQAFHRWVEPFCGSCVVALNVQPKKALLSDSNIHIIRLYQDIQSGNLTAAAARHVLLREHFYHVGASEDLRHPMIEALITNFPVQAPRPRADKTEQLAFFEGPLAVM